MQQHSTRKPSQIRVPDIIKIINETKPLEIPAVSDNYNIMVSDLPSSMRDAPNMDLKRKCSQTANLQTLKINVNSRDVFNEGYTQHSPKSEDIVITPPSDAQIDFDLMMSR